MVARTFWHSSLLLFAYMASPLAWSAVPATTPGGAMPAVVQKIPVSRPTLESASLKAPSLGLMLQTGSARIAIRRIRLEQVVDHPNVGITGGQLTAYANRLLEAKGSRGVTLSDLQAIANQLTILYRQSGYILTKVYIPAQDITADRVLTLRVWEGKLGRLSVRGNRYYSEALLTQAFLPLQGQAVNVVEVEQALLADNRFPGMSIQGVFKPGVQSGETDLLLNVQKEQPASGVWSVDNFGTAYTGRYHTTLTVAANDPLGHADQLQASLIYNLNPKNGMYWTTEYSTPLASLMDRWIIGGGHNAYDVGGQFSGLATEGSSLIGYTEYKHFFSLGRLSNWSWDTRLSREHAEMRTGVTALGLDNLTVLSGGIHYEGIDPAWDLQSMLDFHLHQGFNGLLGAMGVYTNGGVQPTRQGAGDNNFARGRFNKATAHVDLKKGFFWHQSLHLRAEGQFSKSLLTSLQQYSIGGPTNVRAYPTSTFLADKASFFSLEYTVKAPGFYAYPAFGKYTWGDILDISAFVDHGLGLLNDPLTTEYGHATLYGAGFGMRLMSSGQWMLNFQAARPFWGSHTGSGIDSHSPQMWLSFYYSL